MVKMNEVNDLNNAKDSIKTIEGLFHAVDYAIKNGYLPMRFSDQVLRGMSFLNSIHTKLITDIGPEEVQKMKDEAAGKEEVSNGLPA